MENFKRILPFVLAHKFVLVVIFVSTIAAAVLNVSNIALLKPMLEVFFGEVPGVEAAEPGEQLTECPYGEAHPVFPVKPGEELSGQAYGQDYTYCPFGKVHRIQFSQSEPEKAGEADLEEELKTSLESFTLFRPLVTLYERVKVWKEKVQVVFYNYLKEGKRLMLLTILGSIILGSEILKFLFVFLSRYFSSYVGLHVVQALRTILYDHLLVQDMQFFHRRSTGELMSRVGGDVSGIREMLLLLFDDTLQSMVNMLFILAFLVYLNWQLTLLLVIFGPMTILPVRYFGKKRRHLTRKAREKTADISSAMQEIISNMVVVKAFTMEEYESRKFKKETEKQMRYLLRRNRVRIVASPFMDILGTTAVVATMLVGGYFIAEAQVMSSTAFFVYVFGMSRLYKPVKKLNNAYGNLQQGLAYSERIFEILDTQPVIQDPPDARELPRTRDELRFEDVWFAYYDEQWVLKGLNLTMPAGKILALVGPSGAGKSTLVSLILRLYDPQRGAIYSDGLDIREARLKSLRQQIGIVLQENVLFNDTIGNNISCGIRGVAQEKIIQAAKDANAHEFIKQLPRGYDTVVGERGSKLSGGQRQRIAIARAILKDPAILILDEATSSLDSESEAKIQEAVSRLIRGRTTIIIAHRLSTVMNADKIVVLDKGEIVEQGRHHELFERKGLYHRLCEVQFKPLETIV